MQRCNSPSNSTIGEIVSHLRSALSSVAAVAVAIATLSIPPSFADEAVGNAERADAPVSVQELLTSGESEEELQEKAQGLVEEVVSAESPNEALAGKTDRERSLIQAFTTEGEVEIVDPLELAPLESQDMVPQAQYCRNDGVRYEQKALLGNTLYTWWQDVEICGNPGIHLDSVRIVSSGGETQTPTYSYRGQAFAPSAYRNGSNWTTRSGENFEQHLGDVTIGTRTVCITGTTIPTGEFSTQGVC